MINVMLNGVWIEVYYNCERIKDVYGTSDSPTHWDIEIGPVYLRDAVTDVDIWPMLEDYYYNDVIEAIIEAETIENGGCDE